MHLRLLACALALAITSACSSALAADIPVKAPVAKAPLAAAFNWTGWYGGVNYATGVAESHGADGVGFVDRAGAGYSVGVQGGYDWQFDRHWVAGIEGDINWLGIDRRRVDWGGDGTFGVETSGYGTVRARLGYTSGPSLFYVTGGAAFVTVRNRADTPVAASASEIASGWTAGWGIETMLGGNWSTSTEYLYVDAGGQTVNAPIGTATHFENRFHVFRNAFNYRFGASGNPPVLPSQNWTGSYIGVNAGAAAAQTVNVATPGFNGSVDIADTGFTGGAQVGYNWQFIPAWVAGVEADVGWLGIDRRRANVGSSAQFGVETDLYSTVRVRIGRSTGPALLYATGGAAFVRVANHDDNSALFASHSEFASGWTIGGGIEAALGNHWTAKTEYLYINAGSLDVFNPNGLLGPEITRFNNRFHVFKWGLNYQFASGKAPTRVVTKY